jgi:hypothetical protein
MNPVQMDVVHDLVPHKFGPQANSKHSEKFPASHAHTLIFQTLYDSSLAAPFPWTIIQEIQRCRDSGRLHALHPSPSSQIAAFVFFLVQTLTANPVGV